ncbi:HAD-IA family hydrolase [Streptomyces sp. NPDC092307]|uniref:HAD-IA family hydrolase n=1 Tax=Streptomyces sp. NPDC092307 TaxID=3366013 RepID=UPI00381DD9D9
MIEPVELVMFDCDGVLVDTERIALRLQIALGAELGRPLTHQDVVDRFVARSQESICEQITQRSGEETAALWWEQLLRRHRDAVDAGPEAVEGLPEAPAEITLPVRVASGGSHDRMRHTLGVTGLHERFAGRVFSASEVAFGKPAPDLFLHAARRTGVDPAACVVVEDSRPGVRAARAAGIRAFGHTGGPTPAERLAGPDTAVLHHVRELPALLTEQHRPTPATTPTGGLRPPTRTAGGRRPDRRTPTAHPDGRWSPPRPADSDRPPGRPVVAAPTGDHPAPTPARPGGGGGGGGGFGAGPGGQGVGGVQSAGRPDRARTVARL